jgi:glycosyltransferase involved in cell wall biosynthesis
MKVLMLGNYPLGEQIGGVAVHTVNLLKWIGNLDEDIGVTMLSFGKENKSFKNDNVKIKIIKAYKIYYLFPFLALLKLHSEAKKSEYQIIHVQGSNISPYLLYTLFMSNAKKMITVHGLMCIEYNYKGGLINNLLKYLEIFIEKYALSRIPTIIVCSPYMKRETLKLTYNPIYVIPNGIDFQYIQENQKDISLKHPSILYLGMLNEIKGVNTLISAMKIVLQTIPSAHLYIAGLGTQELELKTLVKKLNIMENVSFLGFVPSPKHFWFYKSTDICVFPSLNEPFGIVLLEAMACRKAIVASDVGGIPYIVDDGKTGLLFKSRDFEDLAKKIIILLKNEEIRNEMGNESMKKAKLYNWGLIAAKTCEIYKEI